MEGRADHRMADVFGISRAVPANYVPRDDVDGKFVDSLARDKHVVVFGSSKQGKTCLRKYNLTDTDHIAVTCSNTWNLAEIHSAILKAAGYTVEQSDAERRVDQARFQPSSGDGWASVRSL